MEEEDTNPTIQTLNDTDQLQILLQNLVITDQTNQHNNDQVTVPANPGPESSFPVLDDTFTYDIHNAPDSDSLLYEILSRLPIKPLFKFKCVSKHWLTLISQPSFKRFYMLTANAASPLLPFRILYKYFGEMEVEDVLDRFSPESSNSSGLFMPRELDDYNNIKFKVIGVSNGLVLCCSWGPTVYHVCNPVTRQWVTLAKSRDTNNFYGEGFVSRVNEHNVVASFRVVRLEICKNLSNYIKFEIFSSETGEWVGCRAHFPNPIGLPKRGVGPICFNGILHWFVREQGMVAFDPYKEPKSCRLIHLPADRDVQTEVKYNGIYRLCDECQGKLRYFQVASDVSSFYCFSMWDLKDYDNGEWCSEFKVTRRDLSSSDPELESWLMKATFLPLCFHPFDLDIVYLRCVELGCLVTYNIRSKRLDVACKPACAISDLSWRVVVPFMIPRWPTPVPIPPVIPEIAIPEVVPYLRPVLRFQEGGPGLYLHALQ